ncbi:hypothetical protein R1sor_018780 [Riccia sorocarpa]|uniref:Uncharacterized protein n=1 Tax=Riccia sorocarpa TaxID=122646 RepID=A0ABD3IAR5_9MARC
MTPASWKQLPGKPLAASREWLWRNSLLGRCGTRSRRYWSAVSDKMWILRLSRAENQRGVYARIEYAEAVSRKVLFRGSSPCRDGTVAEPLPSSPVSTISAFGDGSSPVSTGTSTCHLESKGDSRGGAVDVSRKEFRRGFETGFVTMSRRKSVGLKFWGVLEVMMDLSILTGAPRIK